MRVAFFGGSFNPPHIGHVEIVRHLLKEFSRVLVVPCYRHPFGKKLAPFEARYKMCKLAFKKFGRRVVVSDIERKLGEISHTVRTIRELRKKYPELTLVIGSDTKKEMHLWRWSNPPIPPIKLLVLPRGKRSFIPDVSSTEIRRMIKVGKSVTKMIPKGVVQYAKRIYK